MAEGVVVEEEEIEILEAVFKGSKFTSFLNSNSLIFLK
jgi:hypothetical protein